MDEGTVICNKSAEAEYVSLVSSSQFSSQLYIPPSFSFSSSNLFDPSQTSAYPQRWCQYSGDVFAICNPCTPSFETLSPFRKIPLILSRHMACSVFLTFDFTSEGVLETHLPTSSFSPTPSHCCAEREVLACLPVTWSQLPKSAYMLTSVSQHVLCLTFHAVCWHKFSCGWQKWCDFDMYQTSAQQV